MVLIFSGWLAVCVLTTVVWLTRHIDLSRARSNVDTLAADTFDSPPDPAPLCSIIVAAKDEQNTIEACVRSLLNQDYPNLELIVVNDRSTDQTAEILERLRCDQPDRMRVVTVTDLPAGWTGKPNAVARGVEHATGQYLLFTDADCEHGSTRSVSTAVRYAIEKDIEFLSVLPIVKPGCLAESIIQPACTGVLMIWHKPEKVNDAESKTAYANGAFMLIRADAYQRIGGHSAVRNVICEDMQLARNAKAAGISLRVVHNRDLYETHMYSSFGETWRGWSRILHGSLQHPRRIMLAAVLLMIFSIGPLLSLLGSFGAWFLTANEAAWPWQYLMIASAGAVLAQLSVTARLYPLMRAPAALSVTFAIGAIFALGIVIDAFFKSVGLGSTTWRGTTYQSRRSTTPVGPPLARGEAEGSTTEDAPAHGG